MTHYSLPAFASWTRNSSEITSSRYERACRSACEPRRESTDGDIRGEDQGIWNIGLYNCENTFHPTSHHDGYSRHPSRACRNCQTLILWNAFASCYLLLSPRCSLFQSLPTLSRPRATSCPSVLTTHLVPRLAEGCSVGNSQSTPNCVRNQAVGIAEDKYTRDSFVSCEPKAPSSVVSKELEGEELELELEEEQQHWFDKISIERWPMPPRNSNEASPANRPIRMRAMTPANNNEAPPAPRPNSTLDPLMDMLEENAKKVKLGQNTTFAQESSEVSCWP